MGVCCVPEQMLIRLMWNTSQC